MRDKSFCCLRAVRCRLICDKPLAAVNPVNDIISWLRGGEGREQLDTKNHSTLDLTEKWKKLIFREANFSLARLVGSFTLRFTLFRLSTVLFPPWSLSPSRVYTHLRHSPPVPPRRRIFMIHLAPFSARTDAVPSFPFDMIHIINQSTAPDEERAALQGKHTEIVTLSLWIRSCHNSDSNYAEQF